MNYIRPLAASLLVLSGCLSSLVAQKADPVRSGDSALNQRPEIITEYLPQENRTIIQVRKMRFYGPSSAMHSYCDPLLVAEFSYEGSNPQEADTVLLGFITRQFAGRELIIITDSERLNLGLLKHTEFHQGNDCRLNIPTVGLLVRREQFLRISQAVRAKVIVGNEELPFTEEHFEALRELGRRMQP